MRKEYNLTIFDLVEGRKYKNNNDLFPENVYYIRKNNTIVQVLDGKEQTAYVARVDDLFKEIELDTSWYIHEYWVYMGNRRHIYTKVKTSVPWEQYKDIDYTLISTEKEGR